MAVAPNDKYVASLKSLGCRFIPLHMENGGTNPLRDALLMWRFFRLFVQERPDVYLGYTAKPNIYGSLAAHMAGIPVINNIAGLGAVFIKGGVLLHLVRSLYRLALSRSAMVFFQNPDDRELFIKGDLVKANVAELLPGSGIDLSRFAPAPLRAEGNKFRFLLIARMLGDKGVYEYVEAARQLQKKWPRADFCLLGFLDVKNPAAISRVEMDAWVAEGVINFLGVSDDVRVEIAAVDCVVLPSYREGTPRSLLEAAAMARPIIATDVPGCREVVDEGVNGFLCQVRSATALAAKMDQMLSLSVSQRTNMGLQGRKKVESEFDEQIVISKYLDAISSILVIEENHIQ